MIYRVIVLFVGIFLSLPLRAALDPIVQVKGTVIGFDEKVVKISNQGTVTLAPRASVQKTIRVGDTVEVSFNLEEFKKQLSVK
jgi:hypothetical protein